MMPLYFYFDCLSFFSLEQSLLQSLLTKDSLFALFVYILVVYKCNIFLRATLNFLLRVPPLL